MKYCPYCGADLPDGAVTFCMECGNALPDEKRMMCSRRKKNTDLLRKRHALKSVKERLLNQYRKFRQRKSRWWRKIMMGIMIMSFLWI